MKVPSNDEPKVEFWVTTTPCELRPDCGLTGYHIHVLDQIYYTLEEVHQIYERELPVKGADSTTSKGQKISVGEWLKTRTPTVGGSVTINVSGPNGPSIAGLPGSKIEGNTAMIQNANGSWSVLGHITNMVFGSRPEDL